MPDKNLAPVCGQYCGTCEYFEKQCQGCGNIKGKPFWVSHIGVDVCPLYDCCVNNKHLEHCGQCGKLPCKKFIKQADPSLSPEEAKKSLLARQQELLKRKKIGTEAWLKDKEGCRN